MKVHHRSRLGFVGASAFAIVGLLAWVGCSTPAPEVRFVDVPSEAGTTSSGPLAECPGATKCGESCTDVRSDNKNCGACGAACTEHQACVGGACSDVCPASQTKCENGGAVACVSIATDRAHCGACGTTCAAGEVCSNGSCAVSCAVGSTLCSDAPAGNGADAGDASANDAGAAGYCARLASDRQNCGACGVTCASGEVCADGACVLSCPADQIACDGGCVDPKSDEAFCGATAGCGENAVGSAGASCGKGESCQDGSCTTSCPPDQVVCGGACIDPQTEEAFCGATAGCGENAVGSPGTACADGQRCLGGSCKTACPSSQILCNGSCVDPKSNDSYCGASEGCGVNGAGSAGVSCLPTQRCTAAGCANKTVISVTQAMMVGDVYGCGNVPPEYAGCQGNQPGFRWTDTTGQMPTAIDAVFDASWSCERDAAHIVTLNGVQVGTWALGGDCVCAAGHNKRTVSLASVAAFVPNGVNTLRFEETGSNCDAILANPAWGNLYGFVTLTF